MAKQIPDDQIIFFTDKTAPRTNRQFAFHYSLTFWHNRMITAPLNPHDKRQIIQFISMVMRHTRGEDLRMGSTR